MIMLCDWEKLPKEIRNDKVKPYYELLRKKQVSLVIKRGFDVIVSVLMLILLSPIIALISLLIKIDSPGPVFYRQERVTKDGKIFRIHKFRSMVSNADKVGTLVTVGKDSRVTKIGRFIRKYRIDEFPQLIDVLLGDMSFVGTRPEVKKYVQCYSDEMYATLLMPAGITSLASIMYKDEARLLQSSSNADEIYVSRILPEKMRYNLQSIKEFSVINDVVLMVKTVLAVIKD